MPRDPNPRFNPFSHPYNKPHHQVSARASPIVHNIVRSSLRDFPIKYHGDMTWHTAMKLGNKKYFELHPLPPVISIQSLEQIKIVKPLLRDSTRTFPWFHF